MRSFETVAIECDGRVAAWAMNPVTGVSVFTGDPDIIQHAKESCIDGDEVQVGRNIFVEAGDDDALNALAALVSWNPGRALVVDAPQWVWTQLEKMAQEVAPDDDTHADCLSLTW